MVILLAVAGPLSTPWRLGPIHNPVTSTVMTSTWITVDFHRLMKKNESDIGIELPAERNSENSIP